MEQEIALNCGCQIRVLLERDNLPWQDTPGDLYIDGAEMITPCREHGGE